jgi:predicted helicase
LREWSADAEYPINPICICSDAGISKKRTKDEDADSMSVVDLALPASTDIRNIVAQFQHIRQAAKPGMTVVFSTYQSIEVIARAQQQLIGTNTAADAYGIFDLIICDEAHRTTGVTLDDDDESAFVKVHDNSFLQARKRVYMTATPRLFSDDAKSRAAEADAELCSMDDPAIYGEEIYRIGFGEAVKKGLLADYKVLILTLSEGDVPPAIQRMVANPEHEINTDDASKLIGCINALSKQVLGDAGIIKASDPEPMRRAVAFCQNIKVSKKITGIFNDISETYPESLPKEKKEQIVAVNADHIDGSMSAPIRDEKMAWLKSSDAESGECRVLTNVRCLSEGVDVPSLDAVMFLSARNSQVDVVQSVGRVMRRSPGKNYGYIIIPVVIPVDIAPEVALNDNDRFRVVWSVLNALRAHDDRFNATVNQIELNKHRPDQILVGTVDTGHGDHDRATGASAGIAQQLAMQFEQLQGIVFARMVEKVGDRGYWEKWAKDIAVIAERHIERINRFISTEHKHKKAFENFLKGLQKNINPSISQGEAVEMLAQHIITKPVFEALFEGYSFVKNNPISTSMQSMLDLLDEESLEKDAESLQKFYASVRERASGIDNAAGKQRIIVELYDKFFKTAFPTMVERLGIVYTPIELVDFIIRSVDYLLRKEFGRSISDENVHILDPFTGTGTFVTRLLQSGLIQEKDLERKYLHELHANEIVLLAYYIAAINIENAYHDATPDPDDGIGKEKYTPFEGIVLTDTFQLGETDHSEKLFSDMFPQNSERVLAQKKAPLRVIMGNPPYSVGQKSENDNAKNQTYPKLDSRISQTYVAESNTTMNKALYDAYIKAFRWSSDRLDKVSGGVIAFVSNGAWLDGNATSGFRKCIEREFTSIYVFNLRGNQRTSGELSRREGGKIFGSGSRTPIAITFLVKNPTSKASKAVIHYHDIGDYLSREEKLGIVSKFSSVENEKMNWKKILSNEHGDWLNQRDEAFSEFILIADKGKKESSFFKLNSNGIVTNRDAWVYNSSKSSLQSNVKRMIEFYNQQQERFALERLKDEDLSVEKFIDTDPKKISWTRAVKNSLKAGHSRQFKQKNLFVGQYRPFYKQNIYFNRHFNECVYQQPKIFPQNNSQNRVICLSGIGAQKPFSALLSDTLPDLQVVDKCQCFPLYYYEKKELNQGSLFDQGEEGGYIRRDAITDFILKRAQKAYGNRVSKEDIFYYVYGILHSPEYRSRFANDLKKTLPRLPLVDEPKDFWAFSKAGRQLAELHIGYESVPPAEGVIVTGADTLIPQEGLFKVNKMRFAKKDGEVKGKKKKVDDTSIIHYNSRITISNIPDRAYDYIVNGKSAIHWIMERYQVSIHKDSGIKNDPNDWAKEVGNPRYILDLLLSVIRVSVETVGIVEGLPELKID